MGHKWGKESTNGSHWGLSYMKNKDCPCGNLYGLLSQTILANGVAQMRISSKFKLVFRRSRDQ